MIQKQQVNQNTKSAKNESGRSMVEMLGVLAIMGVLAIGGIAGYRWAMDKYRSNDTIKELSERAVVYSQQMIREAKTLSSAEFNPADRTRLGYGLTAEVLTEAPKFFEIGLTDVPQRVCQNIVNEDWLLPVALSVNGVDDIGDGVDCGEETNAMAFVFHQDLEQERLSEGTSRPEETDSETESVTETESESMSSIDQTCISTNKGCIPCDSLEGIAGHWGAEGCESICGSMRSSILYGSNCWLTQCPNGYVHDFLNFGTCVPCSQTAGSSDLEDLNIIKAECQACGNTFYDGYCIPNSRTDTDTITVTETWTDTHTVTDSGSWPEETGTTTGMCDPTGQCCGDTPLRLWDNSCVACDYNGGYVEGNTPSDCAVCDGSGHKWILVAYDNYNTRCASCDDSGLSDHEDNVRNSCAKCGRGVSWASRDSGIFCSSSNEDICPENRFDINHKTACQACGGTWNGSSCS